MEDILKTNSHYILKEVVKTIFARIYSFRGHNNGPLKKVPRKSEARADDDKLTP